MTPEELDEIEAGAKLGMWLEPTNVREFIAALREAWEFRNGAEWTVRELQADLRKVEAKLARAECVIEAARVLSANCSSIPDPGKVAGIGAEANLRKALAAYDAEGGE